MENQEKSLVVIKNLFTEIGQILLNDKAPTKQKRTAVVIFIAQSLRIMEEYFAKINCELYNWINKPLPDVPENSHLREAREEMERTEKIMSEKKYEEKFVSIWYKEWDEEKKYPQRKFWYEEYRREMEEIRDQIQNAKQKEEEERVSRILEAIQKEVDHLLSDTPLYLLETTADTGADLKILQNILHVASAEHFLVFIKRICSILTVEVKKHGRWTEKSLALGKFILSLKEKINGLSIHMDAKISVSFYDIISSAELFLIETNNWIIEKERQECSKRELIEAIETGFQRTVSKLGSIENSLKVINRSMVGINGRLSNIVSLNEKILESIKENGSLIQSLSFKVDGINDRLDDILSIAFSEEK